MSILQFRSEQGDPQGEVNLYRFPVHTKIYRFSLLNAPSDLILALRQHFVKHFLYRGAIVPVLYTDCSYQHTHEGQVKHLDLVLILQSGVLQSDNERHLAIRRTGNFPQVNLALVFFVTGEQNKPLFSETVYGLFLRVVSVSDNLGKIRSAHSCLSRLQQVDGVKKNGLLLIAILELSEKPRDVILRLG